LGSIGPEETLGEYRFDVVEAASGRTLYSQGFSSLFSEWRTTDEAASGQWRCFESSARFPAPEEPFQVSIYRRSGTGTFELRYTSSVTDPQGPDISRRPALQAGDYEELQRTGHYSERLDLLFVAEGYREMERAEFAADARRFLGTLLGTEPFQSRRDDWNVATLFLPSQDSGISDPRSGDWRRSSLNLSFNSLNLDRYIAVQAEHRLREFVAGYPYDLLVILVNSSKYGGGGVYNQWVVVSARAEFADYVFLHELGHALGGLGDEYFTSEVPYRVDPQAPEFWEPNLTRLPERSLLKWRALVKGDTPIPTPWDLEGYLRLQSEAERTGWSRAESVEATRSFLRNEPYFGVVGAFEGGAYQARGVFRPSLECLMFDYSSRTFCPVCRATLEHALDAAVGRSTHRGLR